MENGIIPGTGEFCGGWQVKSGWAVYIIAVSGPEMWSSIQHTHTHRHRKCSNGIWNMRAQRFPTISGGRWAFGFLALHVRLCLPPVGYFLFFFAFLFSWADGVLRHLPRYTLHLLLLTENGQKLCHL